MGTFARLTFSDGAWRPAIAGSAWLRIDIHDSDIAAVAFHPAGDAMGLLFLGFHPRDYFEDEGAGPAVDVAVESVALAAWAAEHLGRQVAPDAIAALAAQEGGGGESVDVFVDETVLRLVGLLGLAPPPELVG